MMEKIGDIEFKEIKRISPSQFLSMKNCAYKSLLAEAFNKAPLLPLSPNAYFGTVLHNMLEQITKGIIKSEEEFNTEFDKQVEYLEQDLQNKGFGFFLPIKLKIRDFGLKKIQLKKHLPDNSKTPSISSNAKFYSEKWFESQDKSIVGILDLVIENGNEVEIIDFKTGTIKQDYLDDNGEVYSDVKHEYKDQLKLYAYLYFENKNILPSKLSLVDLAKHKLSVEFSEAECKSLFEEAKRLLLSTNDCINTKLFLANPTVENCKFCLYRPACTFFHDKFEFDLSFNDIVGTIIDVKKFRNGNVSLSLLNGTNTIVIKNFMDDKYDSLNIYKHKRLRFYNLKRELIEFVYSITDTTIIYEC